MHWSSFLSNFFQICKTTIVFQITILRKYFYINRRILKFSIVLTDKEPEEEGEDHEGGVGTCKWGEEDAHA